MARKTTQHTYDLARGQTITINGKRLYALSGRVKLSQDVKPGERAAKVGGRRKRLTRKP